MFVSVPGDCHARLAMTYGGTPAPDLVSPLAMLSEVETSRRKPHVRCVGFLDIDGMTIGIFEYSITQTKFGYHRAICTISSQSDIIATSDIIHCVRKGKFYF